MHANTSTCQQFSIAHHPVSFLKGKSPRLGTLLSNLLEQVANWLSIQGVCERGPGLNNHVQLHPRNLRGASRDFRSKMIQTYPNCMINMIQFSQPFAFILLKCQVRRPSLLWAGCRLRNGGITKLLQWVHTNYSDIRVQANKRKQEINKYEGLLTNYT